MKYVLNCVVVALNGLKRTGTLLTMLDKSVHRHYFYIITIITILLLL